YLEAQASGLPIVGGNGWGVRDVVRHGVTGLLCDPGEAAAHSAAIAALIGDPVRRHAMGEAARAHVMANHSLEAGANILDDMLKGVLA
ncbi:MAG: glycosyltransferase, partial [Pseudomonadota bacterium]